MSMKTAKIASLAIALLGAIGCTKSIVTNNSATTLKQVNASTFRITAQKAGDLLSLNLSDAENKALIATMATQLLSLVAQHNNADFRVIIDGRSNPFHMDVVLFPASTPPNNGSCAFCQRTFRGAVRNEDSDTIAVEKSNPARQPIDFLIIPKQHVVNYKDRNFTSAILIGQLIMAQKQARKLANPHDFLLQVNNGANAYQTVFHSHMHFSSDSRWK